MQLFTGNSGAIVDRGINAGCSTESMALPYSMERMAIIKKHCYPYHDADNGEHLGNKVRTVDTKDFHI